MTGNWIITEQGDAINLDYVAKIMWGGNFTAPTADQEKRVYLFHGGVAYSAGVGNASTIYEYADAATAEAAATELIDHLLATKGAEDFR